MSANCRACDLCRAKANGRSCVINAKFAVNSWMLLVGNPRWVLGVQRRSWWWSDVSVNGQNWAVLVRRVKNGNMVYLLCSECRWRMGRINDLYLIFAWSTLLNFVCARMRTLGPWLFNRELRRLIVHVRPCVVNVGRPYWAFCYQVCERMAMLDLGCSILVLVW